MAIKTDSESLRTTSQDGRTYEWKGETFDSVTTILGRAIPKPALINWAKRVTAEYAVENYGQLGDLIDTDPAGAIDWLKGAAWRQRDKAANIGTAVHAAVERMILGESWQDIADSLESEIERRMFAQFASFVETCKPSFVMAEAPVFNREYGYAGTLDIVAEMDVPLVGHIEDETDTRRFLIDVKTGKGVYAETALQLVAYRNAEFIGMPDGSEAPMPPVDGAAVLHIRPDGWALVPVASGDREWAFFTRACFMARFEAESRDMIGRAIVKGRA